MKSKSIFITIFLTMILIIISSLGNALPYIHYTGVNATNTFTSSGFDGIMYSNYSLQPHSYIDSILQLNIHSNVNVSQVDETNITLPQSCLSGNILQLKFVSNARQFSASPNFLNISCYNTTSWEVVKYNSVSLPYVDYGSSVSPTQWTDNILTTCMVFDGTWYNFPYVRYVGGEVVLCEQSLWIDSTCNENWVQNNTVCNGVNYTINYYDSYNCGTTNDLPFTNGTLVDCRCYPSWSQDVTACINGVRFVSYTDTNTCNVTTNLPVNNATNQYCSLIPVTDNTPYIIMIVLGIFLVISFVGALMLHEAFFGMCALIIAFMMTTFILYDYPVVLDVLCMFMILLFAVMWVVIARAKR